MFLFPFYIFQHHKQDSQGVDLLYDTRRVFYISRIQQTNFDLCGILIKLLTANKTNHTKLTHTEQNRPEQGHASLAVFFSPYIENIIFSCKTAKHSHGKWGAAA